MKSKRPGASSSSRRSSSIRLAGLVVPRRVGDALARPVDARSLESGLIGLASRLALEADVTSIATADDLVTLVSAALAKEPIAQGAFALRLFAIITPYFDRIGRLAVPRRLVDQLATSAASWPSLWARRCAHQFAAVVYLQADDARQAWVHAEQAYELAAGFDASSGRFETLVLVVGILDNMGLLRDAQALAEQLLDYPGDAPLDTLHLLNAVNGLSLCDRLDDLQTGSRFFEVGAARAAKRDASTLDAIGARFEAAHARRQVRLGSARSAARRLDEMISRPATLEPPVEALLRTAQIEVYAALDDSVRLDASLRSLKNLLPAVHGASSVRRELLKTIIVCELHHGDDDRAVALRYLEELREWPSAAARERNCRPRCDAGSAFSRVSSRASSSASSNASNSDPGMTSGSEPDRASGNASSETAGYGDVLLQTLLAGLVDDVVETSTKTDARLFQEVATRDFARDPWHGRRFADFAFTEPDSGATAVILSLPEREAALRSPAFEVAENWAVVAEIAMGGDGRQCFKVGRVAAGLAAALGLSDERIVLIELACRLRNIGDATIACKSADGKPSLTSHPGIVAEHIRAGERILSFSSDPVLRSAARIAASHHAWWNGNGVPGGLQGDGIPIEARICAVADQLVSLVDPISSRRPWPIETAMRQLRSMAGVQLDPELVDVLTHVLHDEGMRVEDPAWKLHATWNDPFAKARKHLFETLELAI